MRRGCPVYFRTSHSEREALRQMASQRGESEAQFLRCLIQREAKVLLEGEADAKLAPSRLKADNALAFMSGLIRNAKSGR
jgi:hypothetical protein